MAALRNAYIVLAKRPVTKWPLGISRFRCEDSFKMDLKEIRCVGVDKEECWALVDMIMNRYFELHRIPA
jgi:hypothetical protein